MKRQNLQDFDVLVVGAGPAGSTMALNLAPFHRVAVVDRAQPQSAQIGESLVPAARRLFADMGLLAEFQAEGHSPCHVDRSVWGQATPSEMDFLRDPDGHAWHLDRGRFNNWLRQASIRRGAVLFDITRIREIVREDDRWRVQIESEGSIRDICARFLVDAAGRSAPIARRFGAKRTPHDRLVCLWTNGVVNSSDTGAGVTHVEAEESGWWYTASLPSSRRIVAFHTDSDLLEIRAADGSAALLARALSCKELSNLITRSEFHAQAHLNTIAANSQILDQCVGNSWMAVGDAALALDPLSARGIFNALYTGLMAAEALDRHFRGAPRALMEYEKAVGALYAAYRDELHQWYSTERRFSHARFWQRRQHREPPSR